MRLVVLDYSTGDVDILNLTKEAREIFINCDDASTFIEQLGYDIKYVSWMVSNGGKIREYDVKIDESNNNSVIIDD